MALLTVAEAKVVLRLETEDDAPDLEVILPAVEDYLKTATGHDWAADTEIDPSAKNAARMLVVQWYENPAMIGTVSEMAFGLNNVIGQLQVKALRKAEESA
jgi:hypothetical protein